MPTEDSSPTTQDDDPLGVMIQEGRYEEASELVQGDVSSARQDFEDGVGGVDALVVALGRLAFLEQERGQVAEAEGALAEGLELAVGHSLALGVTADLRMRLATLLDFSQREADAVPLYEQAIADFEAMMPPQAEVAAQLRNNLAMIYKGLGKYALAEQHYLKALEILENLLGKGSEEVAAVYNNLGGLYYAAGFAEQAKEMFMEGMRVRVDLLGAGHPDVGQSHCNLATVCHELGDNAASCEHFERGLDILEAHIEEEAVAFQAVAEDYLSLLELIGDDKSALAVRRRLQKVLV
jgi:tetratricopeptide (TPR) repeat protein